MTTNIEQRVMANVGVIYTTRRVFSATMLELYVLVLAILAIWRLVWVTRVLQNFSIVEKNGLISIGNYAVYAVLHTHPLVQVTLAIAAIAFVMLVADIFRSATTPRRHLAY
ncbi:MAG TPA: hypothetical protein VN665_01050 [Candidatus Paceibacterota bacterium]|nr:hypothetical protein [Candidatus Paceibacterota bacterium]